MAITIAGARIWHCQWTVRNRGDHKHHRVAWFNFLKSAACITTTNGWQLDREEGECWNGWRYGFSGRTAGSDLNKPKLSSWELSTETVTDDIDVYKMTDELIKRIEPMKDKILEICKSHNLSPRLGVVMVLSVDKDETVPDVGFGARTIRFLSEIGALINIDYRFRSAFKRRPGRSTAMAR